MIQNDLFGPTEAHFDGDDYVAKRDYARLTGQILRIYDLVKDGKWRTLDQISKATDDPHASVSAQLRNLRKERFGGFNVERRHISDGLYEYRLVLGNEPE